jgi:nucleoside-diphosphate-sugar epimerase
MNREGRVFREPILVTGGTGFLGVSLVERLIEEGELVRVLGRRPKVRWQDNPAVEHIRADITDVGVIDEALNGIRRVYHLAAATQGDWQTFKGVTIDAFAFLLERMVENGGGRMVFVSSLGNYDGGNMRDGVRIDEDFPLERSMKGRGFYALSKTQSDRIAQGYLSHPSLKITILRPGVIYGPRAKNPLIGVATLLKGRIWIMLGKGDKPVPLIYLDDVIEALVRTMLDERTIGKVYNLVHPEMPTQNECVSLYRTLSGDRRLLLRVPLQRLMALLGAADWFFKRTGRADPEFAYKARRVLSRAYYTAARIKEDIGFEPAVHLSEGMSRIYARCQRV